MISIARSIGTLACEMRDGRWRQPGGRQLSSATVGVVGCGHVGQAVARLCRAFGSRVIAHDIRTYAEAYRAIGITAVPLDVLLAQSDFVSLHVPLDRTTRGMFGAREFSLMQRSAFLINTSRGGVVDEDALKHALVDRRIAGAAFDVFATEPPDPGAARELLMLPNFMATPHIGGGTEEAVLAMGRAAIEGLDDPSRQIVDN
jgi:D-3-phosphoglycerate dehydrogenase